MVIVTAIFMHALDYDDADSQRSASISDSRHEGFFVTKYDTLHGDNSPIQINEAWVEHVWYYTVTLFSHGTKKEKKLQLILRLDSELNTLLSKDNHENWEFVMKSKQEVFGKENIGQELRNCSCLMDSILPDTVKILLKRRANSKDTFKVASQITLIKTK
jgi:hypothetical protein